MAAIVDIQLSRLEKLLDDRKIRLSVDRPAKAWLAEKGYDPLYGARPLKRAIQKFIQDPLAHRILSGKVRDGENVSVGLTAGALSFDGDQMNMPLAGAPADGGTVVSFPKNS
jgi:ATP-dependent Clp protease ATP-binding subunit ClpB